jgi:iron only hydrogenase large subunit-like protein
MKRQYLHSIRIDEEKCEGRMKCMRICPTEAIRIRDGKAHILEEKCIDCGECITVCPTGAIVPLTDPTGELSKFKHTIAIPSPSLYAQFGREILPNRILAGLKKLGFDDAIDLAYECGEVSFAIQEYLREHTGPRPVINNACPAIVRLIQVKYPSLIEHISPINVPRELVSRELKKAKSKELGIDEKDIGAFYITPCPVKMISIKQPAEKQKSHLDGAISISDIYGLLLSAIEGMPKASYRKDLESICILGIGWAIAGGMSRTLRLKNSLRVSGLSEILKVFDDIEMGRLQHIDFIEAYSCYQGCVGGSLTVENRYISYNKILRLIETLEYEEIKACPDIREVRKQYARRYFIKEGSLEPRPLKPLDTDLGKAIKKRKLREKIYESLPKIDCGVCGSPTCLAFAEDVVTSDVELADCIYMPLKKVKNQPNNLGGTHSKDRPRPKHPPRDRNKKPK